MKTKSLFAGIAVLTFIGQSELHAQSTWASTTVGGDWATPGNWTVTGGTSAPSSNNATAVALIFDTATQNRVYTNTLTNLTVSSIMVNSGSKDNNVTGNAITLDGGVSVATGNWQTIGLNAALTAGAKSFNITNGQLTYSGVLSGTGGLTKEGGSKLILSNFNTYSGNTIVNAGTLELSSGSATGVIRGDVTVNTNGTLLSSASSSFGYNAGVKVNNLAINGGTVTHSSGNTLTLASVAVTMTGGKLQTTNASGAFDFFDQSGTNTAVSTLAAATSATIAGSINLRAGDNDTTGTVFTVADGGAAIDLLVSAKMVNGTSQGAASVVQKSGAGLMEVSGANTYTGGTIIKGGTLKVTNIAGLGSTTGVVNLDAASGAVLHLATNSSINAYKITMGSSRANTIIADLATSAIDTNISHALGALSLGSSTLTINKGGNVTGTGIATVSFSSMDLSAGNNGTATLAGDAVISLGTAAALSNNIGYSGGSGNGGTVSSKTLGLDGTNVGNIVTGVISNTNNTGSTVINLSKSNSSTWTLSGTNTYTGTTAVNGGTLKAGSTQAFGTNSAVTMANTAGAILDLNSNNNSIGSLTGGGTTGGNVALGSAKLTVGGDNTSPAAYSGVISGTGSLAKTGNGNLVLSGFNTYSGGTTVDNGTLTLSTGGGSGAIRGTLTINSGATVTTTAGDALGYNANTKINTVNIVAGTLTHNSPGNLTLSSATVNMTGGTLQSTGAGVIDLYDAQALGGGNLDLNTAINTLASGTTATIAGKLRLRQGDNDTTGTVFTVADGGAAVDLEVSAVMENGAFQGANSVVQKAGAGTMLLSGVNTYTGATTIKAGTLALGSSGTIANSPKIIVGDAGSTTAVLDVSSKTGGFAIGGTQTLSGKGTVDANDGTNKFTVSLASGAKHAVGNATEDAGIGKQTIDGNLSYGAGSIFEWDLNGNTTGSRGVAGGFDAVDGTGLLTVDKTANSGAIFRIVLGAGVTLSDAFWSTPNTTQSWNNIFSGFTLAENSGFDTSNIEVTGQSVTGIGSFSITGSTLNWTAVPEPSSALVGLLVGAGLLRRRRSA